MAMAAAVVVWVRGGGRAPRAGCPEKKRRRWRSTYAWCLEVRIRDRKSATYMMVNTIGRSVYRYPRREV